MNDKPDFAIYRLLCEEDLGEIPCLRWCSFAGVGRQNEVAGREKKMRDWD